MGIADWTPLPGATGLEEMLRYKCMRHRQNMASSLREALIRTRQVREGSHCFLIPGGGGIW